MKCFDCFCPKKLCCFVADAKNNEDNNNDGSSTRKLFVSADVSFDGQGITLTLDSVTSLSPQMKFLTASS